MRTIIADVTDVKVRQLIEAAANEPVTVIEDGEAAAVVLSPEAFRRLELHDRIQQEAKARLRQVIADMHVQAAERGLTEEEVERLLADES